MWVSKIRGSSVLFRRRQRASEHKQTTMWCTWRPTHNSLLLVYIQSRESVRCLCAFLVFLFKCIFILIDDRANANLILSLSNTWSVVEFDCIAGDDKPVGGGVARVGDFAALVARFGKLPNLLSAQSRREDYIVSQCSTRSETDNWRTLPLSLVYKLQSNQLVDEHH